MLQAGKMAGRYLCKNPDCLEKAMKSQRTGAVAEDGGSGRSV